MPIKNDGKGSLEHVCFETLYAAGAKRLDPNARADGRGGFLLKGYYWKAPGFKTNGPHSSRRVAERDALETIHDHAGEELLAYGAQMQCVDNAA